MAGVDSPSYNDWHVCCALRGEIRDPYHVSALLPGWEMRIVCFHFGQGKSHAISVHRSSNSKY